MDVPTTTTATGHTATGPSVPARARPGAVAAASLLQAVASGEVGKDDCILLNISGGGVERLKADLETRVVEPWLRVSKVTGVNAILEKLASE